jgi:prephenate dehydratase
MEGSRQIVEAVDQGIVEFGLVPAENSVEGEVVATTDALLGSSTRVLVREEVSLQVTFTAWRRKDDHARPRFALSHPHALAQCRNFTESLGLKTRVCTSTSAACHEVAHSTETGLVAIAGPSAGKMTALEPFKVAVEDTRGAQTRFFLLAQAMHPFVAQPDRAPTTLKTLMAVIPPRNRVGVLVEILLPFAQRGVDLASLSSRPLRHDIGQYCFLIQAKSSIFEDNLADAVLALLEKGHRIKFLGSYPSWVAPGAETNDCPRNDHPEKTTEKGPEKEGLPGFMSLPVQMQEALSNDAHGSRYSLTGALERLRQWLSLPVA